MKRLAILALATLNLGAAPPRPHSCTPGPYIVFFDWSSSAIKSQGVQVLNNAIENQGECGSVPTLAGHTDDSEPKSWSSQRLKAVSNYLASRGVFVDRQHQLDFRNTQQRVATSGGVREPQNRRVEITFGPPGT